MQLQFFHESVSLKPLSRYTFRALSILFRNYRRYWHRWRISPRIFETFLNDPNAIFRGLVGDDSWKSLKQKTRDTVPLSVELPKNLFVCQEGRVHTRNHIRMRPAKKVRYRNLLFKNQRRNCLVIMFCSVYKNMYFSFPANKWHLPTFNNYPNHIYALHLSSRIFKEA